MIKKTGLLGIILILLTTAIFAQTKATFEKEGYEITMPAGTVEDKEAEDESEKTFTNQDMINLCYVLNIVNTFSTFLLIKFFTVSYSVVNADNSVSIFFIFNSNVSSL